MKDPKIDIYTLSDEREKKLWEDSIFIFDSSALLGLYFLHKKTRDNLFNEVFENKLKERLWISSHIKFEFHKNRSKVISKPIEEKYTPIKSKLLKNLDEDIKSIENNLLDIKNRTKNEEEHPHLAQDEIDKFNVIFEKFKLESSTFKDKLNVQVDDAIKEVKSLSENDDVLLAVNKYYKEGRYYSFTEILEITKEGKHRYEYSIPPGYMDAKDNEKSGTQIFGDLIIWKQVLEYAKESKKNVILICNDLKEDWCKKDKSNTDRIDRPRDELIKEIFDYAGVEFWMYSLPQFLHNSNKYLNAEIEPSQIESSSHSMFSNFKKRKDLEFNCDFCGSNNIYLEEELYMEFELVASYKRGMGTENEYQVENVLCCISCKKPVRVVFSVFEYPIGNKNDTEVFIDGGDLVSCFDFGIDFYEDSEPYQCDKCGEYLNSNSSNGLCQNCEREYNEN